MNRILLALGCLALVACNSGPGPIVLTDTGPSGTDAPVMGTDAPVAPTDAPAGCGPATAPAPAGMACAASTLTCLAAAGTAAAQQACITADPNAMNCNACILQNILNSCTTAPGTCADEYGTFECCLEAECPTGDATCLNGAVMGACATQNTALTMCVNADQMASPMRCGVSMTLCFMTASPLAPDFEERFLRTHFEADLVEHMSIDWTLAH